MPARPRLKQLGKLLRSSSYVHISFVDRLAPAKLQLSHPLREASTEEASTANKQELLSHISLYVSFSSLFRSSQRDQATFYRAAA